VTNKLKQALYGFIENVVLQQSGFQKAMHRLRARDGTYAHVARDRNGLKFLYAPTDFTIGAALLDRGEWQYDELDHYVEFVAGKAGGRTTWFFDLGANIGTQTVYAARSGKFARVFAVEAIPRTYELLCDNVNFNGCDDIASCFNVALGAENGRQRFVFNPLNPGGSRRNDANLDLEEFELDVVKAYEFVGALLEADDAPEVLAFWIDVEGMEWDLLSELRVLDEGYEAFYCIEYNEASYDEASKAALKNYVESRAELFTLTREGLSPIADLSTVRNNLDIVFPARPAGSDSVE
jgi:FkbM family methyltransferase